MSNNYFETYTKIISEIDQRCIQLHQKHQKHTLCKKGCSQCCMNFKVLPVEFHAILSAIQVQPPQQLNKDSSEGCIFLVDNTCTIYEHRPSICRSHGLPILNMDIEGENWELSFCPLNFTKVDEAYFTLENGFQQDLFNSKLYLANREFVKKFENPKYSENELLELSELVNFL